MEKLIIGFVISYLIVLAIIYLLHLKILGYDEEKSFKVSAELTSGIFALIFVVYLLFQLNSCNKTINQIDANETIKSVEGMSAEEYKREFEFSQPLNQSQKDEILDIIKKMKAEDWIEGITSFKFSPSLDLDSKYNLLIKVNVNQENIGFSDRYFNIFCDQLYSKNYSTYLNSVSIVFNCKSMHQIKELMINELFKYTKEDYKSHISEKESIS